MTNNTNNAPAALLRTALRVELGANTRRISVRHDKYSMGSTIYVIVKDPTISLAAVRDVAARFERVSRDSATGEILSGGNRFVDVSYSDEAIAPLAALFASKLATLQPGERTELCGVELRRCEPGEGGYCGGDYYEAHGAWGAINGSRNRVHCYGADNCARQVAELMLSSQPAGQVAA